MAKGQIKQAQIKINKDVFEGLCKILCTRDEILGVLGVADKTLYSWCKNTYNEDFSTVYKKYAEYGKSSIRRAQFKIAQTNATMAIWLGKQYLGQKEFVETESVDKVEIVNDVPKEEKDE